MQSKVIMGKSKETLLKKYNVDNISKNSEIKKKLREHWFILDPSTGKRKIDLKMEKVILIMQKKYGVDYYFQTNEFKNNLSLHFMRKFGVDNVRKSVYFHKLMVEKGIWYSEGEKDERWNYYKKVLKYTKKNFNSYFDLLCSTYVRGIDYHLDHIFSIYEGFKLKIEPEIIGSIFNLQILPAKINLKKGKQCWITKEELLLKYNKG